jgi:hypothetical protein
MRTEDVAFSISPNKIFVLTIIGIASLVLISLAQDIYFYNQEVLDKDKKIWMLDVDVERSIYTWFSTILLFIGGQVLAIVGFMKLKTKEKFHLHWIALALIFFILSADEAISFHEKVSEILGTKLHTTGIFYFAWVIPALALLLIGFIAYIPFLWSLPANTRLLMMFSGAIFVSGAIGIEMVSGAYTEQHGVETLVYRLMTNLEEGLEGLGVALFIWSVLRMMQKRQEEQAVRPSRIAHDTASSEGAAKFR